jgi:hypothetical protein
MTKFGFLIDDHQTTYLTKSLKENPYNDGDSVFNIYNIIKSV